MPPTAPTVCPDRHAHLTAHGPRGTTGVSVLPSTSVLLVEDDDAIRWCLEEALRTAGLAVQSIPLAAKIFDALRSDRFDVIVLDLGMPRGSLQGMEALTLLRGVDAWREIPVIILSAFGDVVNQDVTR